jgi:uncharacterized pyridoxamine 5'-phosphate oxidase family protein/NAD-dependent dihydropyrimidine dehydrogenase PreA subunit
MARTPNDTSRKALMLLRDIKSVSFATVEDGAPAVRIANVMLVKDDGIYFVTAQGKPFFQQLARNPRIAVCGMDANDVSVRVVGDVRACADPKIVNEVFEHHPGMNDIYPGEARNILEAFQLFRGRGELFDLSTGRPRRERFAFGGDTVRPAGYAITDACTACGACADECPIHVISPGEPYVIDGAQCLECGICEAVCPEHAIAPARGL